MAMTSQRGELVGSVTIGMQPAKQSILRNSKARSVAGRWRRPARRRVEASGP